MPATAAAGPVSEAILAKLKATSALVTRLTGATGIRIWDEPPAGTLRANDYPYALVEGGGEVPFGRTFGPASAPKFGSEAHVIVRLVSQYRGDAQVNELFGYVVGALHEQALIVTGYPTVCVEFQTSTLLKDTINGVVTRELVAAFDVSVHQS
jgi:hypothetical protein